MWFWKTWVPLTIAATGICLLVYAAVQQEYRQSLNDPQIQMAEDGAAILARGGVPAEVVPHGTPIADIASSLVPWIAVYDEQGKPLENSGALDNEPVKPPLAALNMAKDGAGKDTSMRNESRISWQPREGVRSAIVIVWVPESKQFVVAGRNMREVEEREGNLTTMVGLAWLVILGATLFASWFGARIARA
jgi:hypothetical protein